MTPSEVAAAIRRVSPGALPESVSWLGAATIEVPDRDPRASRTDTVTVFLPDDIAEATLIAAMVQDACLSRWPGGDWVGNQKAFNDSDHGGSLGAAYAAWRWARGIA